MAALTVSNYLGMLQDNPDDAEAFEGLKEAIASGDAERVGEQPVRLLEHARHGHERRGELRAVAWLIELEAGLADDDPGFQGALLKELGRLRHEELLDDAGALEAYNRALELKPGDDAVEMAIEDIQNASEKWRQIADRFIEEANDASDATLKTSMLVRAGSLVWQYRKKGKARETDKLFKQALKADPASTRAARLYCITLRDRDRTKDVAQVLMSTAEAARNRDEKLNLFIHAARVFVRELEDRDKGAACYERALDFAPGHEEALRFLVEFFTEGENWDRLVSLYEDALRSRQKLESEQGILLQLGMVHWRIRSAPAEAEPYFARLRKIDPAHPGMLSFYREFLGASEDEGDEARTRLLTILTDAQRVAQSDDDKLALAIELARAAQETDATDRAIDAWKAVQRLDATNEEAGKALRELYRRGQKWNALVEVMRAELDALPSDGDDAVKERRVGLLRELIAIYRDELQLDVMVINTYKALLEERPGDQEALVELGKTYEGMGRWNDLIRVLDEQANATEDPSARVELLMRVARLWIDRFANYNQATKPLEAIVEIEPENREALGQLKTIYTKKRAWKGLYAVLEKESQLASDPSARLQMKVELAKLAGDRLHRNADAIKLWREVLEEAPETEGALDTLEKLADREKEWETLAFALELRAQRSEGDPIKVLQKLGGVYGDRLEDQAKAAATWKRILEIDPKNGRALRTLREAFLKGEDWDGLHALYADAEDWEGLVDVLGSAAERSGDAEAKKELSFRAAAIYEEQLGNPERAFRSYERVLSVDPDNERAAAALAKIYTEQEKWPRLVKMKEILYGAIAEDAPLEDRLASLDELRRLCVDKLSDDSTAFEWATKAYELAPDDRKVRDQLEESAQAASKHEELARLFTARLESDQAGSKEKTALRRKLAGLAGEKLGQTSEAITQLEQILESDPNDEESIRVLDRLYRSEGRVQDLRKLFEHRLEHVEDNPTRYDILKELAEIEEIQLQDAESAAGRHRAILEIDGTDVESLAALDRMAVDGERWGELADVLRRRMDLADTDERTDLTLRLGDVMRQKLDDPAGAIVAYAEVLKEREGDGRAVTGLEEISQIDELKLQAMRHLEKAYEAASEHQKLADVLQARLDASEDDEERRSLRLRLAELAGTALGDPEGAYAALEAAFLDRPSDLELWDRLAASAEAAGKHEDLATAFATAIDAGDLTDHEVTELSGRVAEIYDIILGRPAEAEPFHKRVLHHEPLHERSFLSLKELYTDAERWDDLQVLYRNRIAETVDAEQKLELLLQVCFLFEEILEDPQLAIRSYQEVLELEPDHAGTRRALERLYRRTERWRDLVALLRQELDRVESDPDTIKLLFEIGELHETKLEEPSAAVDQYEAVLEKNPTHIKSQQALERLLGEPSQRQRIATVLEPLYDAQGAWAELANVLEVQLEDISDPGGQVGLLSRLAKLYEDKLHDSDKAFASLSKAVLADPADSEVRTELARVSAFRGSDRERAEVLEKAAQSDDAGYVQAEILLELAMLWDEQLGDMDAAEKTYAKLIEVDGDNPQSVLPAARALERIHLAKEDYAKLADALRLQIQLEHDFETRASLLVRLANLLEETLDDVEGAIAAHRQRLDIDPADTDALRSLEKLYERSSEWQKLIGVLQSRDAAIDDAQEQERIALRIGEIYETKLDDTDNAIVAYNDALSRFGPEPATLQALARLYGASEKWDDLLEVVEIQIERTDDPSELAELRFQAGELMRTRTGDLERAIESYRLVLDMQPGHEGTVTALEEVITDPGGDFRIEAARALVPYYESTGKHSELIGALEVVGETDEPMDKLQALRRAAEVAEMGQQDSGRAFSLMAKAVRAGLSEDDLGQMLIDLERHAAASEKWAEYATLLEDIAPDVLDGELQTQVLMNAASVAHLRMDDLDRARSLYGRLLENQPDHVPALDSLDQLHTSANDHAALLDVIRRKTELAEDPSERVRLLERQAQICEEHTGDIPAAIDAYEQVLGEQEQHPGAYEALERLYTRAERWIDLASTLERQLDLGVGNLADLRFRLGRVNQSHLNDTYTALEHLREAVAMDSSHAESIALLEEIMNDEEHRGAAAEILEPVFLTQMDWPKVTAVLEARLASSDDLEERKVTLRKLGQIHEDYLEDLEGALSTYGRLFQEDIRDRDVWATLSRLANVLEVWGQLGDIYAGALEEGVVDDETAELARMAGRIYDERVGDPERSAAIYAKVLEFDATDAEAFQSLESAYTRLERYDDLVSLYRARIDVAPSDDERVMLLHKLARIQEEKLEQGESAIDVYREVLEVQPDDATATDALDRLLTGAERWPDVVDHVRFQIDAAMGTPGEPDLKHRLAGLLAEKLDDKVAAIDTLEEVVQATPHAPSIRSLEALANDHDHRLRITRILEPLYRDADDWQKLVGVLEAQVAMADDPAEQTRLLAEIAGLYEQRGSDAARAFHAWSRAFAADPYDDAAREQLDRLAETLDAWDEHVAAYEQAVGATTDPHRIGQLLTTVARVHDERRGDPRAAIQTYERLLENDSQDQNALDSLEALHTMVGDWRGLVEVLDRKVEQSFEPTERAELLRRAGSVLEELLGDPAGAVELYRRAAEEDDTDPIALEALDRLHTMSSEFGALGEVLSRRIELETDPELKAEIGMRLGQLYETQLNEPDRAIDAFALVLDAAPSHAEAVASLSRLYERRALWPELLDNLKLQAGLAESAAARVAFIHRAGEVTERELDDVLEALTLYQQALELDNRYEPSLQALIRISHLEDYRSQAAEILEPLLTLHERWDLLADLLALKAEVATDPMDKKDELLQLARVYEQGLQDSSKAFDATARALAEDAGDEDIAEQLERLAAVTDGFGKFADELAARADHALDPMVARSLFVRLARIAEERLDDDARAVLAYQRALEQTGDEEDLLAALDRLHQKTEAWPELAEIIERRMNMANDPVERADHLIRLGAIREEKFGDLRGAFAAFQEVVERDPADTRALDGLERLGQNEELALEVVDTLEAAYRETGALDRIAALYDIRINLADSDGERVRMMQEAAALWENELGQPDKALESLRKAFQIDPRDSVLLSDIERLAATSGAWESLRGMVEAVEEHPDVDRDLRRDLNLRAAAWYQEHLGDPAAAEQRLKSARDADPEAVEPREQIVELLRTPGREADLVQELIAWASVEHDEYAKKDRLREAARLAESALGDAATAAQCFEEILDGDPSDVDSLDDLIRLRTNEARWSDVVPLLERRIDAEMDPSARLGFRRQLAEVFAGPLADAGRATTAFEAVLEEEPEDLDTIAALEQLYEQAESWEKLRELLDRRLDIAHTDEDRIAARVRLARLAEKAFGQRDVALSQLREILDIDPTNAEALDELERLLGLESNWDELAELLDRRASDAAAIGDVERQKTFLVRLAELHTTERSAADDALSVLERVLTLDPNNTDALRKRVDLHEAREDWSATVDALEALRPHLDLSEAVQVCHRIADIAEERLDDPARAAGSLRAAFDLQPSATTRELLKAHYEKHEDWRALAEILESELQSVTDPAEQVTALKRIASLYTENLDEAASGVPYLERAAELTPDDREVLLPLCDIYIAAGRQGDAVPVLEKIIASFGKRRSKELAQFHHRLGRALEGMGDTEGAMKHYDSAFKIDLTNVQILRDLGRLCHANADWPRAQKTFRALLLQKLTPDAGITKADVYFYLGDISHRMGDDRKAISMLERATTEDKGHPQATALLEQLKS